MVENLRTLQPPLRSFDCARSALTHRRIRLPRSARNRPDDRIALLNDDLRNVIEDIRRWEEDLRQERDRWHAAYLAAQCLIPTPAQHDAQANNRRRWFW
jgi:hypothetical protein